MQGEVKILDDTLVADYLRRHPEFFLTQEELLAELKIPHARGSSVSLVERQMSVLRQRGLDMREKVGRLLEIARENDRMFELTRNLTLQLLEAENLETLVATLEDNLRQKFRVPYVGLVFFTGQPLPVGRTASLAEAQAQIGNLLAEPGICGVFRQTELEFLFGREQAAQIASAAVMSIQHGKKMGVLALGSEESTRYSSSVDTLFLGYVAQVMARLLPQFTGSLDG